MLSSTGTTSPGQSVLRISKGKVEQKIVYKLTKPIFMKFRPQFIQQKVQSAGFLSRIKSFGKIFSGQSTTSQITKTSDESSSPRKRENRPLKYVFKIEYDNYLIGNQYQLDSIVIGMQEGDVETDLLWSFRLPTSIQKLIVHDRKRTIILITNGQLRIYHFQGRKARVVPFLMATFPMKEKVELIQFANQSSIVVITQKLVSFYTIDGIKSRQKAGCQYKNQQNLKIFQITQAIDNIINIYFVRDVQQSQSGQQDKTKFFELWCMAVQFKQKCVLQERKMIYLIQKKYKESLKIFAISKDCYIMNLGKLLYLFKKNYYIDKIVINMQSDYSFLQLFNQKTIGLVCQTQIDFYQLITDLVSNPPKIKVRSFDSIRRQTFDRKYMYLDGIKFQEHKYIFFFQNPVPNASGQINYQFYITQKWNFEQKINSILPAIANFAGRLQQQNESRILLQTVDICWDVLNKMGLSRRDAYLRIWKQSKKQSIEQFNLLLDTHDYKTIRQEIQLKLKKKSMLLIQVLKIELGCLNMIQQNVFSSKFTIDQFKNYLISTYFMRKLESFKEIRIYQKQAGKLRVTNQQKQKQTKFFINIQEYTNVKESDIKQEILQYINALCKYRKDYARQIRMLIRKFKFSLKMIYQESIKEAMQTAGKDILYLLQTIPQILPYQYPPNMELDQPLLYKGVWGTFTQLQWEKSMFLDQVLTIYNKDKVLQEKNTIWVKRNWLRYHDMVFLTRQQVLQYHAKLIDGRLFYSMLGLIYQIEKDQDKINDITNYLQDTYNDFPPHLFSHVQLYRQLYLYFKNNSKSSDTYQDFLIKTDQQIMKQIFDHEKAKKGSFLKQVKPIYEKLRKSSKFNRALLKYFSSTLSQPSDIKYLLNRINNQKKQFHAQNQQMYEVLIKGMQIKLKLGSQRDIPIQQVLIYIQNIPLKQQNPVVKELQTLKKINQKGDKLKKTKINMSVFEIIRMRQIVLYNLIGFQIEHSGIRNDRQIEPIIAKSQSILNQIKDIRQKIYGPYQDNVNLFIFLIKILQTIEMTSFIFDIIQKNKNPNIPFDNGQVQNAVYYLYKQTLTKNPNYEQNSSYIMQLISILPEDNHLRMFIQSEFEFASIVNQNPQKFQYPICGQTGVMTILQLSTIINTLDKNILATIDIKRIVQLSKIMQEIIVGQSQIKQYLIYQAYCVALIRNGKIKETLSIIEILLQMQKDSGHLIIYPIIIFRSIFPELIEENKNLMAQVIRILFDRPFDLLDLYKTLLSNSFSNQDQKKLLLATIQKNQCTLMKFDPNNYLFKNDIVAFMNQNPDKNEQFNILFQQFFQNLLAYQQGFNKNPDVFLIYLLILKSQKLALKYISFLRYQINMKMLRGLLSFISQFEPFDAMKVLNYGRSTFKILFNLQKNSFNVQTLISEIFTSHLQQGNLQSLNNSKNCQILALSVDRFKAKIKIRQALQTKSLKKQTQMIQEKIKLKFKKPEVTNDSRTQQEKLKENKQIQEQKELQRQNEIKLIQQARLQKIRQLVKNAKSQMTIQYTYNDSDDYVTKIQKLAIKRIDKLQQAKQFNIQKFLLWMFNRRNQLIQYYLMKSNQDQAEQTLRQLQERLKCSFTKTSNDGLTNQTAGMMIKALQKGSQEVPSAPKMEGLFGAFLNPAVSAIPFVQQSQIRVSDIFPGDPKSQLMMITGFPNLKDQLIKSLIINQDEAAYDYKLLLDLDATSQLQKTLPILIKDIYNQLSLDFKQALFLIRQISKKHSKLIYLNQKFIEKYLKFQQLIKKVNFSIQCRSILPLQGLYIRQKQPIHLFNFVKPLLFQQVNQNNVHVLSKIISVSFQDQSFQQDINSQFLKNIIIEYEQLDGSNQLDQNMKIQKIKAFLLSMHIAHLKMQTPKTIVDMKNKQKKNKIVSLISDTLRKKNDLKSADLFESKYIEVLQ